MQVVDSTPGSDTDTYTDIIYSLRGSSIMPDYAAPLWQALRASLPWLSAEPGAAIHPLARVSLGGCALFLGRHSRLIMRLPQHRVVEAFELCGQVLDIGASSKIEVGVASLRPLKPAAVQYSPLVALGNATEADFLAEAERLLSMIGVDCHMVCGKQQEVLGEESEGMLRGHSLMLHGLTKQSSLRIQHAGLGAGRKLGCGIFVPHKAVAAVGED